MSWEGKLIIGLSWMREMLSWVIVSLAKRVGERLRRKLDEGALKEGNGLVEGQEERKSKENLS